MSLKQFNASYVPQEDRVLFRFSTTSGEEFRLWFTRRMTLGFLGACQGMAVANLVKQHPAAAAQAVDSFQQQALSQSLDFKSSYEPAPKLPLGEEPALLLEVRITPQASDGAQLIEIILVLSGGRQLALKITPVMMNAIRLLLEKLQAKAGWLEVPAGGNPPPVAGPPSSAMH